jgi:methylphosphotriester-DNA--protein-cysteine methyltransferase
MNQSTNPSQPHANSYSSSSARWIAVYSRDPQADGAFVYLVKTTKIYCRPTCKARLARRANVDFCNRASEAEAAGYRACKRCKPELGSTMPEDDAVTKVRQLVAQGFEDAQRRSNLDNMARESGLSKWHFHRVFKKVMGITPTEYSRLCQTPIEKCFQDCLMTSNSVGEVEACYESPADSFGHRSGSDEPINPNICNRLPAVSACGSDSTLFQNTESFFNVSSLQEQTRSLHVPPPKLPRLGTFQPQGNVAPYN